MALTHYNLASKKPLPDSIGNDELQENSVDTDNYIDKSIIGDKLADGIDIRDSTCDMPLRNATTTQVANAYHVNKQRAVGVLVLGYGSSGQPANTTSVYIDKVGGLLHSGGSTTTTVEVGDILEYYAYTAGQMWHAAIIAIIDTTHVRIPADTFQSHGIVTVGFSGENIGLGYLGTIRAVK